MEITRKQPGEAITIKGVTYKVMRFETVADKRANGYGATAEHMEKNGIAVGLWLTLPRGKKPQFAWMREDGSCTTPFRV